MLHLVEPGCSATEDEVLRGMFAARKQVFIDLLHWDVPVLEGRFEIDQFDNEHAAYLVMTDTAGAHLASVRLLPTTRPHILADLYASLCDGAVPRGPGIYEVTRFCLDRHIDADTRRFARDRLVSAIAEFGLAQGIHLYTGVAERAWLRQILALGWKCRQLGPQRRMGNRVLGALAIEIDAETPARLAQVRRAAARSGYLEPHHAL